MLAILQIIIFEHYIVSQFMPHLTMREAEDLKIGDSIYHKNEYGWFCPATIIDKKDLI